MALFMKLKELTLLSVKLQSKLFQSPRVNQK